MTTPTGTIEIEIEIKSETKCYNGKLIRFSHFSRFTKTNMTCALYLPNFYTTDNNNRNNNNKIPVIMYLSGLTCTDENVCQKGNIFSHLSKHNIALIAPDTSPRGANIPGESDCWDFGLGAGFYVDATTELYKNNYNMYSYINIELFEVIFNKFNELDINKVSIMGHSMGGHGALISALKNSKQYCSVSAFAPICCPTNSPWGIKAFTGYLGIENKDSIWHQYDACSIMKNQKIIKFDNILIDIGTADTFLKNNQLQPEEFEKICNNINQNVTVRFHNGYDHSYYFISTFMEDHINYHANYLIK